MGVEWTPLVWGFTCLVFFLVALLYASVGHGGASGYLAVLSLFTLTPEAMATSALLLNVLVAGVALWMFTRGGFLSWRLTWPFLIASIPAAFLGGRLDVSAYTYTWLLGLTLLVAAWRLTGAPTARQPGVVPPPLVVALPVGAGIGWLSGVVGIGGGIFLSPLLMFLHWAGPKETAATSACFVAANSVAALAGRTGGQPWAIEGLWPLVIAAGAGGWIGASLGANHFSGQTLRQLLGLVLVIAAGKLILRAVGSG